MNTPAIQLDTEMMLKHNLTINSLNLFLHFAKDACNWSGTPLVDLTPSERGNLTQLKKANLVRTFESDDCTWLEFTDSGKAAALRYDIEV